MRREWRGFVVLLLLAMGCGGSPAPRTDPSTPPPQIRPEAQAAVEALHLTGEIRGPALGFGPEITLEAWIRSDRWMRADLRYEDEDGTAAHEVLLWGPDTCLLFDRRKGRYTELGAGPGELELDQGVFRVQHALWLALGLWVGEGMPAGRWQKDEWWGRDGDLGVRAGFDGDRSAWTELVWRGERLRSVPQERQDSAWGSVPRQLELSGSILESVVRAQWQVESVPVFGDELLDPLLDP